MTEQTKEETMNAEAERLTTTKTPAGVPPAAVESARPGNGIDPARMPGHWLLARLGKRVLRPGGLRLTHFVLDSLAVRPSDDVVEFAPGLGVTTKLVLASGPASYTAVERDKIAAGRLERLLAPPAQRCLLGTAEATGLESGCATVVLGEAMLTMQREEQKQRIVAEARRLLGDGGRYGIHELCLVPDTIDEETKDLIRRGLSETIHVGARPLTPREWKELLAREGFEVVSESVAPMGLLEPRQLVRDEGLRGSAGFLVNLARDHEARRRVLAMRRLFRRHRTHLGAIALTAVKRADVAARPVLR